MQDTSQIHFINFSSKKLPYQPYDFTAEKMLRRKGQNASKTAASAAAKHAAEHAAADSAAAEPAAAEPSASVSSAAVSAAVSVSLVERFDTEPLPDSSAK